MDGQASAAARFEETFTGPASAVRARIWRQVYGPEYPSWADPFSIRRVLIIAQRQNG